MSLYTHFGSKFHLIVEILENSYDKWKRRVDRWAGRTASGREAAVDCLVALYRGFHEMDQFTGLIDQALVQFPKGSGRVHYRRKHALVRKKATQLKEMMIADLQTVCSAAGLSGARRLSLRLMLILSGCYALKPLLGEQHTISALRTSARAVLD